jgi:hypothetical protein
MITAIAIKEKQTCIPFFFFFVLFEFFSVKKKKSYHAPMRAPCRMDGMWTVNTLCCIPIIIANHRH